MPLLEVTNLNTSFHTRDGIVRAVRDVSFTVDKGETLGIVGESGSGKSVTCYSLMGLVPTPPGRIESGTAVFDGTDLLKLDEKRLNTFRGKRVSMIFQDPMTSLNPYMRVETQLAEPLIIHGIAEGDSAKKRALETLDAVGIPDAKNRIRSYPHEFSGGMRQRVMIAMALVTKPDLLIADEPTTALDVTVQAQILELIHDLQQDLGTAVILISHDLGVVAGFCDRVNVMYAGRVVESGTADQVFKSPKHPYNRALQNSIPAFAQKGAELYAIPGLPPDLARLPKGCAFAPRCEHAAEICRESEPQLIESKSGGASSCTRVQKGELTL